MLKLIVKQFVSVKERMIVCFAEESIKEKKKILKFNSILFEKDKILIKRFII